MTLALEFNDTFDLTAVGTLALALVTVISLVIAARALKQTKEEIEVSRREVEEAHRPVVVPTAVYWGVGKPKSTASIGLNNIGTGPALRITASLELLTTDGMRAGHGGEPKSVGEVAIAAGVTDEISVPTGTWSRGACFAVTLQYADVADKPWETRASISSIRPTLMTRADGRTCNPTRPQPKRLRRPRERRPPPRSRAGRSRSLALRWRLYSSGAAPRKRPAPWHGRTDLRERGGGISPWVWRLGSRVIYVEELPDGTARISPWREPTFSEAEAEAALRERQAKVWPLFAVAEEDARRRWERAVLEHEVERRAQREGRGRRVLAPAVERTNAKLAKRRAEPLPAGITHHSLRRTYASLLYALGEAPPYVMAQMGHNSPNLALAIYAKAMDRRDGEPERLAALVGHRATRGNGALSIVESESENAREAA